MSEAIVGLAGVAIGGAFALAGTWLQGRQAASVELARTQRLAQAELESAQREIAQRYLFQLADSVDSLRHRVRNWARHGGAAFSESRDPGYWKITTLYAFGRALAAERVLALEGAYVQLGRVGAALEPRRVEDAAAEAMQGKLFYYHRMSLAESILEREHDGFRLLTYAEFRYRYDQEERGLKPLLEPVSDAIAGLGKTKLADLEVALDAIAQRVNRAIQPHDPEARA
jgi:hypothetical protein